MSRKPSAGPGWGGPAKGAHPDKPRVSIAEAQAKRLAMTAAAKAEKRAAKVSKDETAQNLKDHLAYLAENAEREDTQVRAAEAWLNRHEGMPVARNINVNADDKRSVDELEADIQKKLKLIGLSIGSGGSTPSD